MHTIPHIQVDNAIYYITTNVYGRLALFTQPSTIIPIIDSLNYYRYKYHFLVTGYVIMPDHLHLLLWPQEDDQPGDIMRDFKKFTAVRLIRQAQVESRSDWRDAFHQAGAETHRSQDKVWQDHYWDKLIYSPKVLRQKLNYLHRNPVRAGLVASPEDYPYSSYRSYVCGDESLIQIDKEWISW